MRVKVLPSLLTFREPLMRPQNSTSLKAQKVTGTWPPGDLENDLANVHHKTFQRLTVKHQSSFKKLLTYIFCKWYTFMFIKNIVQIRKRIKKKV